MPRPPKGTIEKRATGWAARVTMADGTREYFDLPPSLTELRARELAAMLAADARAGKLRKAVAVAQADQESVAQYAERWLAERERRGLRSVASDRGRIAHHVVPALGDGPIAAISPAEIRSLVSTLDAKVLAGELAWKTSQNIWGLVSKLFADACGSKSNALRIRTDNPASGVAPPDRGPSRAKAYLYPSELLALLSCGAVPLRWRQIYALAVYTYCRAGELEALHVEDVDLARGVLHVHRAADRESGELRETKTGEARRLPIEHELRPLLEALLRGQADQGERLVKMPPREDGAAQLRKHLRVAGVKRAELFADDSTRAQLTFHDLRATGITWCAVRGDDPLKIQRRAGHSDLGTTQRYIREAENLREGFGVVFPPLPAGLLEDDGETPKLPPTPPESSAESSGASSVCRIISLNPALLRRSQRELNPGTASDRGGSRGIVADFATASRPVTTCSDGVSSAPTIPPTIQDRPITPRPDAVLDHLAACETLRLLEAGDDLQWLLEPPLGGVVQ